MEIIYVFYMYDGYNDIFSEYILYRNYFDISNNLIREEQCTVSQDTIVQYYYEYHYNNYNKVIESKYFIGDNPNPNSRETYSYNENDSLVEYIEYSSTSDTLEYNLKDSIFYNGILPIKKYEMWWNQGFWTDTSYEIYSYNASNQLSTIRRGMLNVPREDTTVITYDENNRIIRMVNLQYNVAYTYNDKSDLTEYLAQMMDSSGNWQNAVRNSYNYPSDYIVEEIDQAWESNGILDTLSRYYQVYKPKVNQVVDNDKPSNGISINVYPNPVLDFLHISGSNEQSIQIYTIEGIQVLQTDFKDKIDVSGLATGVYFVKAGNQYLKFIKW